MKSKIVLSSIATLALVSFVGCGGGSTPSEVDAGITSANISGIADDDLILNGIVIAKDTSGTLLAEGRTSITDGSYALNVAHSGIVLVNVTCQDGNSTMLNPITSATVACGSEVTLNSLADVEAGVDQTVHISPLTEIVYKRAEAQSGGDISAVTSTEFDDAREEVGLLFGVDPITDSPIEGASAAIVGAIHTLADESDVTSVIDVTNALAEELSDGSADGTADTTVSALTQVMDDENITNNLVDNNATYTPLDSEQLSDIDASKALFTELRTQAMSVVDYDNSGTPGFLDTEAQSMDSAMNDVVLNVGVMGEYLNDIADGISYMLDNNLTRLNDDFIIQTSPGNWTYSAKDDSGIKKWSGTVSMPEVLLGDDAEAQLYTAGTLTMTVNGTLPLDYEPVVEAGIIDSQSFNGTITATKTATGADISIAGKVSSNGTSIELKSADAEVAYSEGTEDSEGNTEPVFNYFKLNEVVLQGTVGGYTIDGSITVNSYAQNAGLKDKGGFEVIATTSFGGRAYCSDNTNYSNALVEITLNGVPHRAYTDFNGYFYGEIEGEFDINDFENAYSTIVFNDNICPTGASAQAYIQYAYSWAEEEIANSGWLPNDITFAGAISRTGAALEGTMNAKWLNAATIDMDSDDAMPLVDVSFNGKLQMPERPEMLLTLTFVNTETANTLGASYSYDSSVINMSALFDSEMDNGDVEITTHTGLRADLKITDGDLVTDGTSKVTKDGSLVGTLEDREDVPVIKYIDGSFESLP